VVVFAGASPDRSTSDSNPVPFAIFDAVANTWSSDHRKLLYGKVPRVVGRKILYVTIPGSDGRGGSAVFAVYDLDARVWTSLATRNSVSTNDLMAVLGDRWVVVRDYQPSYTWRDARIEILDTTPHQYSGTPPAGFTDVSYGRIVRRPTPPSQVDIQYGEPPDLPEVIDLSTGTRQKLNLAQQRQSASIVQACGRVVIAGGAPPPAQPDQLDQVTGLVDIFDVAGPDSADPS
jgi:hypothetical protein